MFSSPNVWGPSAWRFLECIVMTYPLHPTNIEQEHMFTFFVSLQHVLPCKECKHHYQRYLTTHFSKQDVKSKKALFLFLTRLHNDINKRTKKIIYREDCIVKTFFQSQKIVYTSLFFSKLCKCSIP